MCGDHVVVHCRDRDRERDRGREKERDMDRDWSQTSNSEGPPGTELEGIIEVSGSGMWILRNDHMTMPYDCHIFGDCESDEFHWTV